MTDAAYLAWLINPSSIRLVLIEATVRVSGSEITRYMATGAYVTEATDTPANTVYLPIASNGVAFTEQISLTAQANLSAGDIEINNYNGDYDSWLNDIWVNRQIKAFIGDPRWIRSDFRMIFNGVVADIDSKDRTHLNLKLRDKLQRLNTPVLEALLGGATTNANMVLPVTLGECHNVTPLLTNPATLEYQVHNGAIEDIIEVRDNGKPYVVTKDISTGKFYLLVSPVGVITASVQGDKPTTYYNTISKLVQRLVTGYGTDPFVSGDLDTSNLSAFDSAHPQPVGIYLQNRENVLATCQTLAASIGAQVLMSREGLLRLLQITMPPSGTPTAIGIDQMVQHTLHLVERTEVVASVKLGYCKNWTVQNNLLTTIPVEAKALFASEWLSKRVDDPPTKANYKLNTEPVETDVMLLVGSDASAEATRQLALFKVPRSVYQFEGTPDMLLLELGDPVTLTHPRFGLSGGVLGMVVSLAPNWMTGHVTVGVLI